MVVSQQMVCNGFWNTSAVCLDQRVFKK